MHQYFIDCYLLGQFGYLERLSIKLILFLYLHEPNNRIEIIVPGVRQYLKIKKITGTSFLYNSNSHLFLFLTLKFLSKEKQPMVHNKIVLTKQMGRFNILFIDSHFLKLLQQ